MADLVERIARAILLHEEACDVDAILATTEHAGDCPFAPDPRPYTRARCQAVGARGQARLILKTLTQAGFVIVPREPSEAMIEAGVYELSLCESGDAWESVAEAIYRAMIATAEAENRDA